MGSGRGRSEGAELEGENKRGGGVQGWRGLYLSVRVMGGCVGSEVRKFSGQKSFLTALLKTIFRNIEWLLPFWTF